jgi:hypothetical protein
MTETLDKYFDAITRKNLSEVLAVFDENAVISTTHGEFRGYVAISRFYLDGIFKYTSILPIPGPKFIWENQIAIEISLNCDGEIKKVGDFFTIDRGKITRMVVYSGAGYENKS